MRLQQDYTLLLGLFKSHIINRSFFFSDAKRVELYEWKDPVLGCRKIPTLDDPMEGLIPVLKDMKFSIDTTENVVKCGGKVCTTLIYRVL